MKNIYIKNILQRINVKFVFEKIDKTDNPLTKLIKSQRKSIQFNKIRKEHNHRH